MVDRLLTGLTAQQKGTTARWYSNKNLYIHIILNNEHEAHINSLLAGIVNFISQLKIFMKNEQIQGVQEKTPVK